MKRIILSLFALVVCFTLYSQEHLKFKGIEMNGSVTYFCDQLKEQIPDLKGKIVEDHGMYTGSFAGVSGCSIIVYPNPLGDVRLVVVVFPEVTTWATLKSNYNELNATLQKKYGKASGYARKFETPYEDGDGYELSALSLGKVSFGDVYTVDKGEIMILMNKGSNHNSGSVMVSYTDEINNNVETSKKQQAAYDDL